MKQNKKEWIEPELIVISRKDSSEPVLEGCKSGSTPLGGGGYMGVQWRCEYNPGCFWCLNMVAS